MTLLRAASKIKTEHDIIGVRTMDTKTLVKRIANFHKNYKDEFLKERIENEDVYLRTPKDALFFILSYSFYQGRRDEISSQFEKRAKNALNLFLENNDILSTSASRITDKDKLKEEYKDLYNELVKNKVNKEGDRLMVISLVNFVQFSDQKNILRFLIEKIKSNSISEAYKALDELWSIGPKIASLILRDIVYIYRLEENLNKEEDFNKKVDYYSLLQPIDTWVHKVSREIGLVNKDKIYENEAKDITKRCLEFKISPIHYNQGAWYIGKHALQILLKNVEVIK